MESMGRLMIVSQQLAHLLAVERRNMSCHSEVVMCDPE